MAKSQISDPHDKFFKAAMQHSEVAKAFFEHYLPAEVRRDLKLESLRLKPGSYLDERLQASFSDMVFECEIAGADTYLCVLVEHQSTPDKFMPFRMLSYCVGLIEQHLKSSPGKSLPAVYPMVFYHGQRSPYPYSLKLADCFDDPLGLCTRVFTEQLRLIDAGQLSDEELRKQQWVGPMIAALKHIRDQDISPILPRLAIEINALEGDREAILGYIRTLLYYLMNAGNVETIESLADQPIPLPEPVRGELMTIAEQLKSLGRQEGLQQGRQEGLQEAAQETALKMLNEGADLEFISRVTGLSLEELAKLKRSVS